MTKILIVNINRIMLLDQAKKDPCWARVEPYKVASCLLGRISRDIITHLQAEGYANRGTESGKKVTHLLEKDGHWAKVIEELEESPLYCRLTIELDNSLNVAKMQALFKKLNIPDKAIEKK